MIQIDTGWAAIFVTIFLSLLAGFAWLGTLWQRVNGHDKEIKNWILSFKENREENRQEHKAIMEKMDSVSRIINTNNPSGG